VFEWVTTSLGAQGTICGGGRYDGLVEQLGGQATPAVGFGLGLERLTLMLEELDKLHNVPAPVDVYLCAMGEGSSIAAFQLAEKLRHDCPNLRIMNHCGGGNFKKQMKRADKVNASIALILGESELTNRTVTVKFLRDQSEQQTVTYDALLSMLQTAGE
jgi:histidyl-tRNA synthetase